MGPGWSLDWPDDRTVLFYPLLLPPHQENGEIIAGVGGDYTSSAHYHLQNWDLEVEKTMVRMGQEPQKPGDLEEPAILTASS